MGRGHAHGRHEPAASTRTKSRADGRANALHWVEGSRNTGIALSPAVELPAGWRERMGVEPTALRLAPRHWF